MSHQSISRRTFMQSGAAATASLAMAGIDGNGVKAAAKSKPALLGGEPVRSNSFPGWPQIDEDHERVWLDVLRERKWCRLGAKRVEQFESEYAKTIGTQYCLATANGTSALFASLNALDVAPGDEVLVSPYTFIATVNVILLQHALPIFVDTDRRTFEMDATKVESAITENTRAMIPVHLGGNVVDMDTLLAVSKSRGIPVVEDACQAHLAEWRGKRVGSLGDTGCFSFQVTKNLCSGEGGAVVTDREDLMAAAYEFHTNGRAWRGPGGFGYSGNGANLRMTEFQGALLTEQMTRLEAQSQTREQNAAYLTKRLKEIPGILPAESYEGCTRNAYHLYMFRVDSDANEGLSRDRFIEALRAEGIPCMSGYTPLYDQPFLKKTLTSRSYQYIYPKERIDAYFEQLSCPENDRLCSEAVWFGQTMLLGPQSDMDDIANAIEKIHLSAKELVA